MQKEQLTNMVGSGRGRYHKAGRMGKGPWRIHEAYSGDGRRKALWAERIARGNIWWSKRVGSIW